MTIVERAEKWEQIFSEGIDSNSDRIRLRMAFLNGASAALAELRDRAETPEEFVRAWHALTEETFDARQQTCEDAAQEVKDARCRE